VLEDLSRRLNVAAAVEFAGSATWPSGLAERLGGAAVYVSVPSSDGTSVTLLEAMAAGVAVIATSVGDVSEMLDGGRAGVLVPAHDVDRLAGAIHRLAMDPVERYRLGSTARARVEAHYQQRHTVETLYRTYLTVLDT
jgi:glycosyltransferase involved in cell wall biosynthesis